MAAAAGDDMLLTAAEAPDGSLLGGCCAEACLAGRGGDGRLAVVVDGECAERMLVGRGAPTSPLASSPCSCSGARAVS
jgi:hypothetical protein